MRGTSVLPCVLETAGEQQSHIKFTPKHGGPHTVHLLLHSVEVTGKTVDGGSVAEAGMKVESDNFGDRMILMDNNLANGLFVYFRC